MRGPQVESLVSLSWCIRQGTCGEGDGDADYPPLVYTLKLLYSWRRRLLTVWVDSAKSANMTDEKGETWSASEMSKVRSRPESLVADCSTPALERRRRQFSVHQQCPSPNCSICQWLDLRKNISYNIRIKSWFTNFYYDHVNPYHYHQAWIKPWCLSLYNRRTF